MSAIAQATSSRSAMNLPAEASGFSRGYRHGPHFLSADQVEFALWAPTADKVELLLDDQAPLEMEKQEFGWFTLTRAASSGDRYRYRINGENVVPDPASRFQPDGVHGASELVQPMAITTADAPAQPDAWQGRPWHEAVIYELHVGTFSKTGTYDGVEAHLDYLKDLGVTMIELMPLSNFEGERGWGYDGVLSYAPDNAYGRPEELRSLIAAAHARGIMMVVDVVYNHFGPSGNYLHSFAEAFFTERYHTPWGIGLNYEGEREVRDFFIENAVYWIEEYGFDGLRLDATDHIHDASPKHMLDELAEVLRNRFPDRPIHIMLENDRNIASHLARSENGRPVRYTAQWNEDYHHAMHVLLTGETSGYYADHCSHLVDRLRRCFSQGFDYQGEPSPYRKQKSRGEKSGHLPPGAFVAYLQNHDQIGNRAMGDRISALSSPEKLELGTAMLLLGPFPPLLFMGEEWAAGTPFNYFCDFDDELGGLVRDGRCNEFSKFDEFADEEKRALIPDPTKMETYEGSKLNWSEHEREPHRGFHRKVKALLKLRHRHIIPLLAAGWERSESIETERDLLDMRWYFHGGQHLRMLANIGTKPAKAAVFPGKVIYGESGETIAPNQCRFMISEK